jgi:hypothetical protein
MVMVVTMMVQRSHNKTDLRTTGIPASIAFFRRRCGSAAGPKHETTSCSHINEAPYNQNHV